MVTNPFPTSVCSKMKEQSKTAKLVVEFYRAGAQRSPHSPVKSSCLLSFLIKKKKKKIGVLYFASFIPQRLSCAHHTHLSLPLSHNTFKLPSICCHVQQAKPQKYKIQSLFSVLSAAAMSATVPLHFLLTWQENVSMEHFMACFCDLHYTLHLISYQCC